MRTAIWKWHRGIYRDHYILGSFTFLSPTQKAGTSNQWNIGKVMRRDSGDEVTLCKAWPTETRSPYRLEAVISHVGKVLMERNYERPLRTSDQSCNHKELTSTKAE
uniref:Uncharacterized protein n=1 Tax=Rhinopithecus roxellana TaxID=61622 RepID=A0A2K6NGG7_RHIRO